MTSSRFIAVVWLMALFAVRDAQAQRRTHPRPKRDPAKAAAQPVAGATATRSANTYPPAPNPPAPNPPATKPPIAKPPIAKPPIANPPATKPPIANAPATNAPATNAPATNAPATNPPAAPKSPAQPPLAGGASKEGAPRPRATLLPFASVGVEPRWEARSYRHTEFTAPDVRSYNARGYAAIALDAELYPLSDVSSTFWRGLGVILGYVQAVGLQSQSRRLGVDAGLQSLPVDTYFSRYAAGLRYRLAVNPESAVPLVFGTSASFYAWNFDFGAELPRGPDLEVPTADYRMVRFGIDAGVSLSPFTFLAAVSYLHAFSVEAPNSRERAPLQFPHLITAKGMGSEIRAAAGIVWRRLEMRVSAEYAVLAFHLAPIRGRQDQAALVVDSYVSVGLGAHYHF